MCDSRKTLYINYYYRRPDEVVNLLEEYEASEELLFMWGEIEAKRACLLTKDFGSSFENRVKEEILPNISVFNSGDIIYSEEVLKGKYSKKIEEEIKDMYHRYGGYEGLHHTKLGGVCNVSCALVKKQRYSRENYLLITEGREATHITVSEYEHIELTKENILPKRKKSRI